MASGPVNALYVQHYASPESVQEQQARIQNLRGEIKNIVSEWTTALSWFARDTVKIMGIYDHGRRDSKAIGW